MSITLDDLFTLFEEVEKSGLLLEERETKLVLPRLFLSEDFGKEGNVDRKELERIVLSATRGAGDAFDRLRTINEQMKSFQNKTMGKVRSPARILSQIMLLETFNRLFKSFGASPAGFINEGILSVFYGGTQEDVAKGNKENQIGDVIDDQGNPISIKTKTSKAANVEGSIFNLYQSINRSPNKKVIFDVFVKEKTGETQDGEVGSLTAYRFEVNTQNINEFLGQDIFNVDENGLLVPKFNIKKSKKKKREDEEGESEEQPTNETLLSEAIEEQQVEEFFKYLFSNPEEKLETLDDLKSIWNKIFKGQKVGFRQLGSRGGGNDFPVLVTAANRFYRNIERGKANEQTKQKTKEIVQKLASLQKREVGQAATTDDGGTLKGSDFHLRMNEWLPLAMASGIQPVQVEFSDNTLRQVLERAVEQLNGDITEMFDALQGYNTALQTYLTSTTRDRQKFGRLAQQKAGELPRKTQAVVKSAGAEEEVGDEK